MSKQKIKWGSNTPDKKLAGNGFHANSAEFVPTPVDETDDADFTEYTDSVYDNIPNYRGDKYKNR